MNLYNNDNKDYEALVKENIKNANLLYALSEENKTKMIKLLNKKEEIIKKNGIFANFQLDRINKKIEKIETTKI